MKNIHSAISSIGVLLLCLVISSAMLSCKADKEQKQWKGVSEQESVTIPMEASWSDRVVQSTMKRAPEAWMNDTEDSPRWNYTQGLILNSIFRAGLQKGNEQYLDYAQSYVALMIGNDGQIRDYDISRYNIDHIAPGPLLFNIYKRTGEKKYLSAIETLKKQLDWQPKTNAGGYWHKLRYPWQIWLDGLYMGEPFLAEYAVFSGNDSLFSHIADQFVIAELKPRDPETGLLYHGWDESRIQQWADPQTGCSPHFWGRAIGWYCMGLVEVLDLFPVDHPQRENLAQILSRTLDAVQHFQDPETHTWWQVLNLPAREGNYLESSVSCMITYAMIRGYNKGYLTEKYEKQARQSYQGILDQFVEVDANGEVHLTHCCSVAGLGGTPYRDGSFAYYISEPVRNDDPKSIGPFILASLEFESLEQ